MSDDAGFEKLDRERYLGMRRAEAEAMARSQGWRPRSVRRGDVVTAEYQDGRLNLHIDENGIVVDLSTG